MKEHPILFSGQMVREIMRGRKTQTRRVIKGVDGSDKFLEFGIYGKALFTDRILDFVSGKTHDFLVKCPYGLPGDRLWVRETWAHDDMDCKDVRCGNRDHIWWKANETKIVADSFAGNAHWRPSIHMPRWASRIDLQIINIRVERVREITRADIDAEATPPIPDQMSYRNDSYQRYKDFEYLWNSINAKRGYGWDFNPWVWVIDFRTNV